MEVGPVKFGGREPVVVMHESIGATIERAAAHARYRPAPRCGVAPPERQVVNNGDWAGGATPHLVIRTSCPALPLCSRPGLLVYERDDDDFVPRG